MMSLPDLIEIVPLTTPVQAEITVPGSKSITNRALICAALAEGDSTLTGALTNGGNHTGTITLGDLDPWTFTAAAGGATRLEQRGDRVVATLELPEERP